MTDVVHLICPPEKCTGCGSCYQKCPNQCITMVPDPVEGFLYPQINLAACIHCNLCRKSCPACTGYHIENLQKPIFFGARLPLRARRMESSSGGVFRAFSEWILQQNGLVAGVHFNRNFEAEVALTDSTAGRDEFCRSKYVQAANEEAYSLVAAHLTAGKKVLFTGTPCLVAGLYAFLGKDHPNLFTVDFICHGVPSPLVFKEYIHALEQEFKAPVTRLNFRDKSAGWTPMRLTVNFQNGKKYSRSHEENAYFKLFLAGGINRPSCYHCPYTKPEKREADLTMGDAWKIPQKNPSWDDNTGVSTVIINSPKGRELFQQAAEFLNIYPCLPDDVDSCYLHRPGKMHPDRSAFFKCLHTNGVQVALNRYAGPRPFFRRLKTRSIKIFRKLFPAKKGN